MRRSLVYAAVAAVLTAGCGLKVDVPQNAGSELTGAEGGIGGAGSAGVGGAAVAGAGAGGIDGAAGAAGGRAGSAAGAAGSAAGDAAASGKSIFASETEGVTSSEITICAHVPITGASPVDRVEERFGAFYFNWLNKQGGIHGRKVKYKVYDDRYRPDEAVKAANRCKSDGAFIIAGAAGTDQLVAVAKWARDNKRPYLMGPASIRDISQYTPYAKMTGPDYEYQHQLLADVLVKEYGKDANYGMIRVASQFFDEAQKAYVAALRKHGIELVVDERVQKDENNFTTLCSKLRTKNAQVVNNFTTPIIWLKMMEQCPSSPEFNPTWTAVSPAAGFNLVAEILTKHSQTGGQQGKALVFHHFNPAYPASKTDEFPEVLARYPYQAEIRKFQEIFAQCEICRSESESGKAPRDDIDWSAYLAAKSLHRLLETAGKDLTRTKLWTMLDSYKETPERAAPGCPADFTRAAHRGAWYVNIFKLGTRQWENVSTCIDRS
jgi:ABC-type branched-subunit amino acid transport system substrate-binding protein